MEVRVAALSDLPENSMRAFVVGDRRVAVYRVGAALYATDDICSHEHAYLSEGWLDPDDCTVECPLHGARFDLASGRALSLPAYEPVAVYPVRADGDDLLVEMPGE
jgi:nitrite reductase/ring-hydroxylating ferredoxin subunit